MGNRCVITADNKIGVYLHWNGGPESVLAFLEVAKQRGFRDPVACDHAYGMARLTGLIHEFFGTKDTLSLGIGVLRQLDTDNGDNGLYILGPDWTIQERKHVPRGCSSAKTVEQLSEDERVQYDSIVDMLTK